MTSRYTTTQNQYVSALLQVLPPARGVLWTGASGSGKTYAARLLAQTLYDLTAPDAMPPARGVPGLTHNLRIYYSGLNALLRELRGDSYNEVMDSRWKAWTTVIRTAHFVILDEVGWEPERRREVTEEILDFLIEGLRAPLLLLSNKSLAGLREVYSEMAGSRLSRLTEYQWPAELPDLRDPDALADALHAGAPTEAYCVAGGPLESWLRAWAPDRFAT